MRVFLTGGTGYIGSAVVAALRAAGHEVASLSRSAEKDQATRALGAEPVRGDLSDLSGLAAEFERYDGLVHLAQDYGLGPAADRRAIDALLGAARRAGGRRSVIYTSGVWVLGNVSTPADESGSTSHPFAAVAWRPQHERDVLAAGSRDLAVAVIRPGIVWGEKRGLLAPMLQAAEKEGAATYPGTGEGRWSPVHRADLADLYRRVLESHASGVFHGVDGTSPRLVQIARSLSEAAGKKGAVRSVPLEEVRKAFGPAADALAGDQVVVSKRGAEVGWVPRRPRFPEAAAAAWAEWRA